jgi:hypothetical protein
MTEAEWLACIDPEPMLSQLGQGASPRKYRMFAIACCRRLSDAWKVPADPKHSRAIEIAERYADGLVPYEAKRAALDAIERPYRVNLSDPDYHVRNAYRNVVRAGGLGVARTTTREVQAVAVTLARVERGGDEAGQANVIPVSTDDARRAAIVIEAREQAALLRDIFGPASFRPITLDPRWPSPDVLALARGIYDERAFDRMPILGDALEDAGCGDADVLGHCRSEARHVLGCWVVDALLGKA